MSSSERPWWARGSSAGTCLVPPSSPKVALGALSVQKEEMVSSLGLFMYPTGLGEEGRARPETILSPWVPRVAWCLLSSNCGCVQQSGRPALGTSGKEVAEDHGPQGGQGSGTEPGSAHGVAEVVEAAEDGVGSPHAVWVSGLTGAGAGAGHHGALVEGELWREGRRQSAVTPPWPSQSAPFTCSSCPLPGHPN